MSGRGERSVSPLEPGSLDHRVLALLAAYSGELLHEDEMAARLYGEAVTYDERQEMHGALAHLRDLGFIEGPYLKFEDER